MEWAPVLRWLLGLVVLTGAGAPLATLVFDRFPGRGGTFALPVGLLSVAFLTAWIGQVTYGTHAVFAALALTAGASVLVYWRGHRPEWAAVGRGFAVVLVAFAVLLAVRAFDPTVSEFGGEQFLHFGMVNALGRAPALPPEDVWFAGEPMRYYYGSQLQVSALSLLTGTAERFAFTLGPPTFYSVLAVSAYGLGAAILDAAGRSSRLGGVLAAVFVAVGGATTTAVRLFLGALPEDVALAYGRAAFAGLVADRGETYAAALASQGHPGEWGWFFTRYVVPGTIQEFPLYSFVKADLHGHTLSTGYVVLAAALAFAYYRTPTEERWRRRGLVGTLAVVAGLFGFMNTWSLPTAVGLATLAVAGADAHPATLLPPGVADRLPRPGREGGAGPGRLLAEAWRAALGTGAGLLVGLAGVVLAAPFLVFGEVPVNEGIGFLPPAVPLGPVLVMYGGLLSLFVVLVCWRLWAVVGGDRGRTGHRTRVALGIGLTLLLAIVAGVAISPVAGALLPLLAGGWWLVRTDRAGYEALLLVAGVGLLLSMELVFAKVYHWESAGGRWETSLKVAVQAWTVMAVAAGTVAATLLLDARDRLATLRSRSGGSSALARTRSALPAVAVTGLVVLVVLASLPFAALVASDQVVDPLTDPDQEASIDAFHGHDQWSTEEMAAIHWLADRNGTPTIAEATVPEREWAGRVASFTGLPTVIGWSNHEEKFRGAAAIEPRVDAVESIYTGSWSSTVEALRTYDVRYVFVGPTERDRYGGQVPRFHGKPGVSVAFENPSVTIYRIDPDGLAA